MNKKELIILRIYLNKFPICSPISLRGFPVWLSCCCPPDVPADWLPCCCPPCCCPPCCSLSPAKPLSVEVSLPKSPKRGVVSLLILVGGASGVKACSSSILPISSPAFTCPPLSAPGPPPCCCPPCCCPPDVPAVWFCELPSVWANMGFDKIVETIPIANSRKV